MDRRRRRVLQKAKQLSGGAILEHVFFQGTPPGCGWVRRRGWWYRALRAGAGWLGRCLVLFMRAPSASAPASLRSSYKASGWPGRPYSYCAGSPPKSERPSDGLIVERRPAELGSFTSDGRCDGPYRHLQTAPIGLFNVGVENDALVGARQVTTCYVTNQ